MRAAHALDLNQLPAFQSQMDRRVALRRPVRKAGTIEFPGGAFSCMVQNYPKLGARFPNPLLSQTIYRVVQEALMNVIKHAQASTLHVAATMSDEAVTIESETTASDLPAMFRLAGD